MYLKPLQHIVNRSLLLRDIIYTKFHKALIQPLAGCLRNKLHFTHILSLQFFCKTVGFPLQPTDL